MHRWSPCLTSVQTPHRRPQTYPSSEREEHPHLLCASLCVWCVYASAYAILPCFLCGSASANLQHSTGTLARMTRGDARRSTAITTRAHSSTRLVLYPSIHPSIRPHRPRRLSFLDPDLVSLVFFVHILGLHCRSSALHYPSSASPIALFARALHVPNSWCKVQIRPTSNQIAATNPRSTAQRGRIAKC